MKSPKYATTSAAQTPILSEDHTTVVGWVLRVILKHGPHEVSHEVNYDLPEPDWFPYSEIRERVTASTYKGHVEMNTFAVAEAKMDELIANS